MLELAARPSAFADILRLKPNRLRAVELERDYDDPAALDGYIPTPFAGSVFERLAQGLRPSSTERAWRVTGDYGSGKSSLALAFARHAAGEAVCMGPVQSSQVKLQPVLAAGRREPLVESLRRAVRATVARLWPRPPRGLARKLADPDADPLALLDAVGEAVRADGLGDGLLLVLDELGKNLEHAARHPDAADLHLLQRLADAAPRSGASPLFLLAVLHQSIPAYADALSSVERREWSKISGRLQEIAFAAPVDQTATLAAAALDVNDQQLPRAWREAAEAAMDVAADLGWYGPGVSREALRSLAPKLLPLHPAAPPVLSRVLRRLGQNERSLFGFLGSAEPFGLLEHASRRDPGGEPYRLSDLYDYVRTNLSGALEGAAYAVRWNLIDGVIRSTVVRTGIQADILKTIGILNLLDDPVLIPTRALVHLALSGSADAGVIDEALAGLQASRLLHDRGLGGFALWPHTSVDLGDAFERALRAVEGGDLYGELAAHLTGEPLVARRHYVETGALRSFRLEYVAASSLIDTLDHKDAAFADGRIVIVLSQTPEERREALARLDDRKDWPALLLVGVPEPLGALRPWLSDVKAWGWVRDHTPELAHDRLAREEVARQLDLAEDKLRRALGALVDLRGGGALTTHWRHQNETLDIRSGRDLVEHLSTLCTRVFHLSPKVRNELINRRTLSSAAARARSLLIEALATKADQPRLGLDPAHTPPEMAIYLSVLEPGRIHVERKDGWVVEIPQADDPLSLRPALERVGELLQAVPDRRVPYEELAAELRQAPYGVRDGLAPLLLAIYVAARWHQTAVYEDGTYLDRVGGPEFVRMLKEPEFFTLQHCAVEGVRAEVFRRLAAVLDVDAQAARPDLLDVVRPLVLFASRLPDHVRRTRRLSAVTVAVRDALLSRHDPTMLIFSDLPGACGLEPFAAGGDIDAGRLESFVVTIRMAIGELRDAYGALLARTAAALAAATDTPAELEACRAALIEQADPVARGLVEPELKTFVLRLADRGLSGSAWLESVASMVARKPPERWADADELEYHHRLQSLAQRFRRVRRAASHAAPGRGVRLTVTAADGREFDEVVILPDPEALAALQSEVSALLRRHGRLGLMAAAGALIDLAPATVSPATGGGGLGERRG